MLRIPQKTIHDYFLLEDLQNDFTYLLDILKQISKNATDYGITGIEADDNTDKIQELLNEKGNIYFPEGTYTLTKLLNVYSDTTITAHPKAVFIRKHPASMMQTASTTETTGYNGEKNIRFNGGIYKHNGHADGSNVFSLFHAEDIVFNDVVCLDTVEAHCLDIVGCNNIKVYNCKFKGYIASTQTNKEAIQIDTASAPAYPIYSTSANAYDGTPSCNITIENCIFCKSDSNRPHPVAIGQHGQYKLNGSRYRNIKILNNLMIGDPYWTSSYGIKGISWQNAIIKGNTIENYIYGIVFDLTNTVYDNHGEVLRNDSTPITVSDEEALFIGCRDIIISNNTINSASTTSARPGIWFNIAQNVIDLSTTNSPKHRNITITDNIINMPTSTTKSYGIDFDTTENAIINGNSFINKATDTSIAVACQDYCKNIFVGDNNYENISEANILYAKSNTEKIKRRGKTALWTGKAYATGTDITLSNSIDNYDEIIVQIEFLGTNYFTMDFSSTATQSFREFNLTDSTTTNDITYIEMRLKRTASTTIQLTGNKTFTASSSAINNDNSAYYVSAIYGVNR